MAVQAIVGLKVVIHRLIHALHCARQITSIRLLGQTKVQKDVSPTHITAPGLLDRQDPKALKISHSWDSEGITRNGAYIALLPVRVLVFCDTATKDRDDTIIPNSVQPRYFFARAPRHPAPGGCEPLLLVGWR